MYLLEGNIGVGKSTFLKLLQKFCPAITVIQEPQTNWSGQSYGQSLLGRFYEDPKRWAYTIETLAMVSRIKDHDEVLEQGNPHCLMERSVYSGHYCFAYNDFASGYFSDMEWAIYSKVADFLLQKNMPPLGFVYLKADSQACLDRIKKRNRKGEENITFDYLEHIGRWHDKFLIEHEGVTESLKHVPVLVLDANCNILADEARLLEYINKVEQFICQRQPRVIQNKIQEHSL